MIELERFSAAPSADELAAFVALEQRARSAQTVMELAFIIANEFFSLVPFSQAAVLDVDGRVICLSGVSVPDERSPFNLFLKRLSKALPRNGNSPVEIDKVTLPVGIATEWEEWLSDHALWVPSELLGWSILAVKEVPFTEGEILWLARLCEVFGHARRALLQKNPLRLWKWPALTIRVAGLAFILGILVLPMRLTALAPAEIVPTNPTIVRSPLDGVIEKIHVQPNQTVDVGQRLVDLDTTTLSSKFDVAMKDFVAAQAEYRQTMQQAVSDTRARAQLAIINGRIEMRGSEIAYLKAMLEKSRLTAPKSGIVILDEPTELVGRPVSIGERLVSIAETKDVEIEAWVGLGDAIDLSAEARVMLVLNSDPLKPVHGQVRYMAYEAQARPDGTAGYRLRARIAPNSEPPRLGLRGTLRLDGTHVTMAYWILRRPLAHVRQMLGL